MYISVCLCVGKCLFGSEEDLRPHPTARAGVTGGCEPTDETVGDLTQVLCKSSLCF